MKLLGGLEDRSVTALHLSFRPVPAELARIEGTYKGAPLVVTARCYEGASIALARFVNIACAELVIENLLILGRPSLSLPIFGVDLVSRTGHPAMLAADLSALKAEDEPSLERHLAGAPSFPLRRELPAWAERWFSRHATFADVAEEQRDRASARLSLYLEAFLELATRARPGEMGAIQGAYLAAHRDEDRGLMLLEKMIDPQLARRLLREVLFPERWPL